MADSSSANITPTGEEEDPDQGKSCETYHDIERGTGGDHQTTREFQMHGSLPNCYATMQKWSEEHKRHPHSPVTSDGSLEERRTQR
mmetsp:Transcript_12177/g.17629  ORF Transcript_12177/g.17629 Transcript_12177/m.17629 type:complete len:86 (-) Transcript_12177:622-879(-)